MVFNIIMEQAMRAIRTNPGGTIYNRMTKNLIFTDDIKGTLLGAFQEWEHENSKTFYQRREDQVYEDFPH